MSNDTVFLFTFSPIQPFITEARRTADLHTASQILIRLARAAGEAIQSQGGVLVYPTDLTGDVPNKLAALIEWQHLDTIVAAIDNAFDNAWGIYHAQARQFLLAATPQPDQQWDEIWVRQVEHVWERYWSAARMSDSGETAYRDAYRAAQQTLDARKRTRTFTQAEEPGEKDTLSGRRQALTVTGIRSRDYWSRLRRNAGLLPSDLRPGGRERLDALGSIKRFCDLARGKSFPSTSSLAARSFSSRLGNHPDAVQEYIKKLTTLLDQLIEIEPAAAWKYDGDLLYVESLTQAALDDNYILTENSGQIQQRIQDAVGALLHLYRAVGERPNIYYAVLALDGDSMGAHVDQILDGNNPHAAHSEFSGKLAEFGARAKEIIETRHASPVYIGGDDVLALVPLRDAVPLVRDLSETFHHLTGATCSSGVAIVHHTYPLSAALQAARRAEKQAKEQPGKDTLCIRVMKRSGEVTQMLASRTSIQESISHFEQLVELFQGRPSPLSGRLPYAVAQAGYALPKADGIFSAELDRLVQRHSQNSCPPNLADSLTHWAETFWPQDDQVKNLACWLGLARFIAKGGRE